jgi:hypothetical protein
LGRGSWCAINPDFSSKLGREFVCEDIAFRIRFLKERVMNILALVIQLVSGAVGGNVVGSLVKKLNLGVLGNSIAGILGGGIGGQILAWLTGAAGANGGSLDLESILKSVASGGVGGGVLMAIIGAIKQAMGKPNTST